MDTASLRELNIPEILHDSLLKVSNSSTLSEALQALIEISRINEGRTDLASKRILPAVLQLSQCLIGSSSRHLLLLSLRLLRNLCAGDAANQDSFIELNGVQVVSDVISGVKFDNADSDSDSDSGYGIIRAALQVLANVSLAGEEHQRVIWDRFFPNVFYKVAKFRRRVTCDPLCRIVYTCSDGRAELFDELCGKSGLAIMSEIVLTASEVGFGEDWLKLLISRICLEESHFPELFSSVLSENVASESGLGEAERRGDHFTSAQGYLLRIVSEVLNERLKEIRVCNDFALYVLGVFEKAANAVDFRTRGQSSLPTGSAVIDVLGYSLTVLRDACANGSSRVADAENVAEDVVNMLVRKGMLDLLLHLLRELELPSSIRRTMSRDENPGLTSESSKVCPYKGFRRDIVAVLGNCSYRRKNVQDEIRRKNGVVLLLQQCVLDEDNPFLREWGLWCARNILEGNAENQQLVAGLEMQGAVDVPELAGIGLRAEVDPNTGRARLVNLT